MGLRESVIDAATEAFPEEEVKDVKEEMQEGKEDGKIDDGHPEPEV